MGDATCADEGCDSPARKRGLCEKHYQQVRRKEKAQQPCSIEGCTDGVSHRGWCIHHYLNWRTRGDPLAESPQYRIPEGAICSVPDCGQPVVARGWCKTHYQRWHKRPDRSDPAVPRFIRGDDERRFWEKINKDGPAPEYRPELGPCWVWTAPIAPSARGYPYFRVGRKTIAAYRFAYELLVEPVPEGLDLDHLCRVHACVNPDHLEPVPRGVNVQRGWEARKAERDGKCANGHEMTPENTYVYPNGKQTACRVCVRDYQRTYKERQQVNSL